MRLLPTIHAVGSRWGWRGRQWRRGCAGASHTHTNHLSLTHTHTPQLQADARVRGAESRVVELKEFLHAAEASRGAGGEERRSLQESLEVFHPLLHSAVQIIFPLS